MDLQHQLLMQFPNLQSHGMNHPPTDQNALISKMLGYAQLMGFVMLFMGSFIFRALKMEEPPAVKWMQENKMNAFCGVWMLSLMSSQLMATGAFEVYYNGNVVYSKLDTGSIPHVQDLARSLQLFGVMPSNSAL